MSTRKKHANEKFAAAVFRASLHKAERDYALDLLARLVAIMSRDGSYLAPEDQATLRVARAVLAEHGRGEP